MRTSRKAAACTLAALALAATPLSPAFASSHYHGYRGGHGHGWGVPGLIIGTAAAIVTAPLLLAEALAPRYAPAPGYYGAPPPAYYQQPGYAPPPGGYYDPRAGDQPYGYAPQQQPQYGYAPQQQPQYYGPQQQYYAPQQQPQYAAPADPRYYGEYGR